ncbi:aminotransferase class IV [Nannocystis sp. ILAH1]|uniref:aminotransferase class IV n=1 Tax=unclassified Nannocystis TaxID=2627009 RepID=UPI00226E5E37|nr:MULTISPECIES: aminotransferase class IV [unclassified Nannocystis]MCY0991189.1 aminotransferase class IV [Nannocystis sp. ILAH1]MCY1064703.1 aminotransferase class IV [Nannocystis sp. RBIL2]
MTDLVWLDGQLVPAEAARFGLLTHSLHYGTAVFDGGRHYRLTDGGVGVFRLDDHLRRFLASAESLWMSLPWVVEQLREATLAVVRASGRGGGYVRQLAFYGDERIGLGARNPVHVAVVAWEPGGPPGAPVKVRIASLGHGAGWIPTAKHAGHYGRAFLALREAQASGHDDALFLGDDGTVVEATGANLFIVRDGRLVTPPDHEPLLPGITRATVLALAADLGIPALEAPIPRHHLVTADEVFLANSAAELRPVVLLEGRRLPAPGPVTAALVARYSAVVRGDDPQRRPWIARVEDLE